MNFLARSRPQLLGAIVVLGVVFASPVPQASARTFRVPGRIAISSDGNYHDLDDILSSAIALGILAKTGNAPKLVHYDYADHIWATDTTREEKMRVSTVETARRFGGFNLSRFFNAKRDPAGAVADLASQIDRSSPVSPLWIVAAGPMEIVGRALAASSPGRRRFVHVISHSTWNDNHAVQGWAESPAHTCCYTWDLMKQDFPQANFLHIVDQNPGLDRPYSENFWLRDSSNANLRWLWCRGQGSVCPEFNGYAAGAGKSTFDDSDAGMAYWLVTGGCLNLLGDQARFGDQNATPAKLRAVLGG